MVSLTSALFGKIAAAIAGMRGRADNRLSEGDY
jgi:hypothetical protein